MCLWGVSLFSSAVFVVLALLVCAVNASPTFLLGFFLSVFFEMSPSPLHPRPIGFSAGFNPALGGAPSEFSAVDPPDGVDLV